jgi:hypothetical protein
MWAGTIVMLHPTFERLPNMGLVDRNDEIQAFAASTSDPPFADRIRLRRFARSLNTVSPNVSKPASKSLE